MGHSDSTITLQVYSHFMVDESDLVIAYVMYSWGGYSGIVENYSKNDRFLL